MSDAWLALSLPGEPKSNCRSPFREENSPSFSIYDGGRKWKDHGSGESGDVVEFVKVALGGDYAEARDWFLERLGIDERDGNAAPVEPFLPSEPKGEIQFPCEILEGSSRTWEQFSELHDYTYAATWTMVQSGVLRFGKVGGSVCFVVTDAARRSAEIRKVSGKPFFGDSKQYPLKGVDKAWPVGGELLDTQDNVFVSEGASDTLCAYDQFVRYRKSGGDRNWLPIGILGAKVNRLDRGFLQRLRGRHVRLCPDGDDAGDAARESWTKLFRDAGASVDAVEMPRGRDLSDVAGEIEPEVLFA